MCNLIKPFFVNIISTFSMASLIFILNKQLFALQNDWTMGWSGPLLPNLELSPLSDDTAVYTISRSFEAYGKIKGVFLRYFCNFLHLSITSGIKALRVF